MLILTLKPDLTFTSTLILTLFILLILLTLLSPTKHKP